MLIYHHDFSNAGNNPLFMSCIFKNQSDIKKKKNNGISGHSISFSVVEAIINNKRAADAYFNRNESLHKC